MSVPESIGTVFGKIIEISKEIPPEKLAILCIALLGTASIVRDVISGNPAEALEKVSKIIDMK
ncbi:MAG: hypothetical protein K2Y10_08540 [Burkholderiaceae bacterium]|nr:hypothetical protein [Burkholderiaceae bacterium]